MKRHSFFTPSSQLFMLILLAAGFVFLSSPLPRLIAQTVPPADPIAAALTAGQTAVTNSTAQLSNAGAAFNSISTNVLTLKANYTAATNNGYQLTLQNNALGAQINTLLPKYVAATNSVAQLQAQLATNTAGSTNSAQDILLANALWAAITNNSQAAAAAQAAMTNATNAAAP